MPDSAVLLMDLQTDFLSQEGRMPVDAPDAGRVIDNANAILDGKLLRGSLPILVVNQFPRSARVGNFFRRYAAVAASPGAELDGRIRLTAGTPLIAKSVPSAFSNPELDALLRAHGVTKLYIFGVFAEGCVRSTALDALRRGYAVTVPVDAIGSSASWKRRFAVWALRRAGAVLVPTLPAPDHAAA